MTNGASVMTAEEVAEIAKVTIPTVYRWAKTGALPAHKVGRVVRFNEEDIETAFGLAHEVSPSTQPIVPSLPADEDEEPSSTLVSLIAIAVISELEKHGYRLTKAE